MSQVYPLIDGFIGYGDEGASIQVETGTPIDSDHPVVVARPELFTKPVSDKRAMTGATPAKPTSGRARTTDG